MRQETEQKEGRIAWRIVIGTDAAMVKRETEKEYQADADREKRETVMFAAGMLIGIVATLVGVALTRM
jgi:uncharacterized oligopeptide transporter (OPT) family protein